MKSLAVLIRESGASLPYTTSRPLEIVEIDLAPPGKGEVLVKIE
ncbi:MAG: alcohol dehydrogenase, partial [Actinobacteria bacterium]|nr:alcohol dehydrogenase [Actinomycetota bacterium]